MSKMGNYNSSITRGSAYTSAWSILTLQTSGHRSAKPPLSLLDLPIEIRLIIYAQIDQPSWLQYQSLSGVCCEKKLKPAHIRLMIRKDGEKESSVDSVALSSISKVWRKLRADVYQIVCKPGLPKYTFLNSDFYFIRKVEAMLYLRNRARARLGNIQRIYVGYGHEPSREGRFPDLRSLDEALPGAQRDDSEIELQQASPH